jgi:hypothetical protein
MVAGLSDQNPPIRRQQFCGIAANLPLEEAAARERQAEGGWTQE